MNLRLYYQNQSQVSNELTTLQAQLDERRKEYDAYCVNDSERELVRHIFASPSIKKIPDAKKVRQAIVEALGRWWYMTGSQPLGDRDLILMARFVYDNYSQLNVDELDYAMNLCLTGKLECDPSTYGYMSPAYVARVLNAYMEYKEQQSRDLALKKMNEETRRQMEADSVREETPEIKLERLLYFIRECKANIDKKARIVDFGNFVFNYLKRKKLVKLTQEEIRQAKLYAAQRINEDKQEGLMAYITSHEAEEKRYAREWVLRKFFQEVDAEDLCNELTIDDL